MGRTVWVSVIADNLNADTSNTYTAGLTLDPPPAGPRDSSIAFHYQFCYYHGLNWSWSGHTSYPRTIAVRGCSPPGGTLTAKLLLDGETIATATQYVPVRDPAVEASAIEIAGLATAFDQGQSDTFTVTASDLNASHDYLISRTCLSW